jgi:hypothetical protein
MLCKLQKIFPWLCSLQAKADGRSLRFLQPSKDFHDLDRKLFPTETRHGACKRKLGAEMALKQQIT